MIKFHLSSLQEKITSEFIMLSSLFAIMKQLNTDHFLKCVNKIVCQCRIQISYQRSELMWGSQTFHILFPVSDFRLYLLPDTVPR